MQVFVVGSVVVACSVKVAQLPLAGESLSASAFLAEPGGKGFNLALALSRLGVGVDGIFCVGEDMFASVISSTFSNHGFSSEMLLRRAGSTGAGVAFIDSSGENCLAVSLGANRALAAADIHGLAPRLQRSDLVAATFESPDDPIDAAFALARRSGIRTLLNPSPFRRISPSILSNTSILVVNTVEAAELGIDMRSFDLDAVRPPPAIERLLGGGLELIIVTLGDRGAAAFHAQTPPYHQAAFEVAAVDTVGAGDAFAAGFVASLLAGKSLRAALRSAAACGALTTLQLGAFNSFPTAASLMAFLDHKI